MKSSSQPHVHTPRDGRGFRRQVIVNGRKVDGCFYADIKRGIADCYRLPHKVHKYGKRLITKRLRGKVEVVPCQGTDSN